MSDRRRKFHLQVNTEKKFNGDSENLYRENFINFGLVRKAIAILHLIKFFTILYNTILFRDKTDYFENEKEFK